MLSVFWIFYSTGENTEVKNRNKDETLFDLILFYLKYYIACESVGATSNSK